MRDRGVVVSEQQYQEVVNSLVIALLVVGDLWHRAEREKQELQFALEALRAREAAK